MEHHTNQAAEMEIERLRQELAAAKEELRKVRRCSASGIRMPVSVVMDFENGQEVPTQFLADASGVYLALIYEDPLDVGFGFFPGPLASAIALAMNRLAVDRPETETER